MSIPKNLQDKSVFIGETFGHWTVIDIVDVSHVLAKCDCGSAPRSILLTLLRCGRSNRCESCKGRTRATHGESKTKLYFVWYTMRNRCNNPNNKSYSDYGGCGIKVCEEWDKSYVPFRNWSIRNGYVDGLEIDRIDNNSGYSPDNCRWVTRRINANNKSNNVKVEIENGATVGTLEISEISGISQGLIAERLRHGWSVEKAMLPSGSVDTTFKPKIFVINGNEVTVDDLSTRTGLSRSCILQRFYRRNRVEDIFATTKWNRFSESEINTINDKINKAKQYYYSEGIA